MKICITSLPEPQKACFLQTAVALFDKHGQINSINNDEKLSWFYFFLQVAKKATVLKRRKSNETRKSQKLEENARNASIQSTNGAGNCEIETEEACFNEMEPNVSSKQGKFLNLNF